ncbi:MAG: Calx-beta domain-containing protein, partial [Verrucomicrobiia bacterium]
PSDYLPLGNSITLLAGQTSTNIVVTPVDDETAEPPETVVLTIVSATGATIGSPKSATITIADNDSSDNLPIVSVIASDPVAAEPGADTGEFLITRDRGTNAPLTVNFTVGGTATSGVDYDSIGTSVTIPAGAWSVHLTVVPRDDTTYEGNETVVLTLTAQGTARVSPQASSATVTIMDNESAVSLTSTGFTTEDGSSIGAFVVSRAGPTYSSLTVNLGVGGTAINGVDYIAIADSVTFPAGADTVRIEVRPLADGTAEEIETVALSLLPGSGYTVIAPASAVVFILDTGTNVPPTITVQPTDQLVTEGCDATFCVTAVGAPPLSYQWYFNGTNPVAGGTNNVLLLADVHDSNAGFYSVVVSNSSGSVTSSSAALVINHRPLPASPTVHRYPRASRKLSATALLGTDPDGDSLFLSSVAQTSARGAAVTTGDGWVMYLPPAGLADTDSFDYVVSDGRGGLSTGTVTVTIVTNTAPSLNLTWADDHDGSVRITGNGVPGYNYTIEYTDSITEPDWQPLSNLQADDFGCFECMDWPPAGSPSRFYRATTP